MVGEWSNRGGGVVQQLKLTLKRITLGDCNLGLDLPHSHPEGTETGKRPPGEWETEHPVPLPSGKIFL